MNNNERHIMHGVKLPKVIFGIIGALEISNCDVVFENNRIIVIPYDKWTNKQVNNKMACIDKSQIKSISVSEGNFGFFKIIIHGYNEDLIGFQISKNITQEHKDTINFIKENYIIENGDMIINKKVSKIGTIISMAFLLMIIIIGSLGAIYNYGIMGIVLSVIMLIVIFGSFKKREK